MMPNTIIGRNMKTNIILLLFGIITGIFLLYGNGLIVGEEEKQDDKDREVGIWTPDTTIEQTFIASRNNLSRLEVAFDSYQPWNSPYLNVRLFEIETTENPHDLTYEFILQHLTQVRFKRVNGWLLSIHTYNSFSFEPIEDSHNKRYLISITSPGVKHGGTSILLASRKERYEDGNLFVDGEKQNGDLSFRALYRLPRIQLFPRIAERLALYKPFPFSKPVVYYGIFLAYVLLCAAFLRAWTKE